MIFRFLCLSHVSQNILFLQFTSVCFYVCVFIIRFWLTLWFDVFICREDNIRFVFEGASGDSGWDGLWVHHHGNFLIYFTFYLSWAVTTANQCRMNLSDDCWYKDNSDSHWPYRTNGLLFIASFLLKFVFINDRVWRWWFLIHHI